METQLRQTAAAYLAGIGGIAAVTGRDTAFDYYERLRDDADMLDDPTAGRGFTAAQWLETTQRFGTLDLSLANQLLARHYVSMAGVRGWGETLVRSSRDGTMQPVAVYVPPSYSPDRPVSLLVFLHGRLQAETQLLAPFYIAQLSDTNSTVVVAPWGRGYYDFRGAESDVYDALDAATAAFNVDPRKRYLAGYSMGAFSVFEIAPLHPDRWSAVMCIAGALWGEDAQRLVSRMRTSRFYVLDRERRRQRPHAMADVDGQLSRVDRRRRVVLLATSRDASHRHVAADSDPGLGRHDPRHRARSAADVRVGAAAIGNSTERIQTVAANEG